MERIKRRATDKINSGKTIYKHSNKSGRGLYDHVILIEHENNILKKHGITLKEYRKKKAKEADNFWKNFTSERDV